MPAIGRQWKVALQSGAIQVYAKVTLWITDGILTYGPYEADPTDHLLLDTTAYPVLCGVRFLSTHARGDYICNFGAKPRCYTVSYHDRQVNILSRGRLRNT